MLDAGPYLRPGVVPSLLPVRQLPVPISLALQVLTVSVPTKHLQALLGPVRTVGIHILALVVRAQEFMKHLGVMHTGIRHRISPYQLVLHVHIDMVLVPIIALAVLLEPPVSMPKKFVHFLPE